MLDNNENLATISEFADYLEEAISEVYFSFKAIKFLRKCLDLLTL